MPLPSFLKRNKEAASAAPPPRKRAQAAAAAEAGPVEQARTQARRRLIGAVVLLGAGIVVFPLVFETQPRPISPSVPIETPKGGAAPTPVPPARLATAPRGVPPAAVEAPVEAAAEPASAPVPTPVAASRPVPSEKPAPKPVDKPVEKLAEKAPEKHADKPAAKPDEGKRAQALLEAAPAPAAAAGRFVVQVGAYTDAAALRDARAKVEKLGLKTYTQVVETDAGKRTRVRVGPFATRAEADSAGAKLKSAGLPAAVLTL